MAIDSRTSKIWECKCQCHSFNGLMKHCIPCCSQCPICGLNIQRGMEDLHNAEYHPEEKKDMGQLTRKEQEVVDTAEDLMKKVLVRIKQSTRQYGTNYVLANVMKETDDEMLDLIGWPLLEMVRMRQLFLNKLGRLDGEYLDKFLTAQTLEYLSHLKEKIDVELIKRDS